MGVLEPHPLAELFPAPSEADYDRLLGDIREHGLLDPIEVYEGKILDGRTRYRACVQLGIEPKIEEWVGNSVSPLEYVVAKNLHRRHLTIPQLAALGAELMPRLKEEAKDRQAEAVRQRHARERSSSSERGGTSETIAQKAARAAEEMATDKAKGEAAAIAGEMVGVSRTSVLAADLIRRTAPGVFEKMKTGEIPSISKAAKMAGVGTGTYTPKDKSAKEKAAEEKRAAREAITAASYSELDREVLSGEMPCPCCARWTPTWVVLDKPSPDGSKWKYEGNRGKNPRARKK